MPIQFIRENKTDKYFSDITCCIISVVECQVEHLNQWKVVYHSSVAFTNSRRRWRLWTFRGCRCTSSSPRRLAAGDGGASGDGTDPVTSPELRCRPCSVPPSHPVASGELRPDGLGWARRLFYSVARAAARVTSDVTRCAPQTRQQAAAGAAEPPPPPLRLRSPQSAVRSPQSAVRWLSSGNGPMEKRAEIGSGRRRGCQRAGQVL